MSLQNMGHKGAKPAQNQDVQIDSSQANPNNSLALAKLAAFRE
jgi:hypothetical protein